MKSTRILLLLTVLTFAQLQACSSLSLPPENENNTGKAVSSSEQDKWEIKAEQTRDIGDIESSDSTTVENVTRKPLPTKASISALTTRIKTKSVVKPTAPSPKRTTVKPTVKPAPKPAAQSAVKPAVKSAIKPVVKQAVQPALKPAVQPVVQLALKPVVQPVVEQTVKPATTPLAGTAALQVDIPAWISSVGQGEVGENTRFENRAIPTGVGVAASSERISINGVAIEMVRVPGGVFPISSLAGVYESLPVEAAYIRPFMVGRFEVSQEEWRAVMGYNPSNDTSCSHCSVNSISWDDIQEFVSRLNQLTGRNFRLISEIELEFACRSDEGEAIGEGHCGGDNEDSLSWSSVSTSYEQIPVGRVPLHGFQLYNARGGGIGWGHYCWDGSYYVTPIDLSRDFPETCNQGVLRGGAWYYENRFLGSTYPVDASILPNRYIVYGIRLAHDE